MAQYVRNTLQGAGLTDRRMPTAPMGTLYDPSPGANQYQAPQDVARRPQYMDAVQNIVNLNRTHTQRTQAIQDFAAREAARQQAAQSASQFQQWAAGLGGQLAGSPFTGGGGGGGGSAGPVAGGTHGYSALGQKLAAQYGWGSGSQWNALNQLVMHESGWNPNAQNPSSSAYGIGQFLDSTWGTVGGRKTSDPTAQIQYMLKYIAQRYGSPAVAWGGWSGRYGSHGSGY